MSKEPKLKGSRGTALPTRFMDPSAGKRLGIFEHPKPGQKVMPLHEPTLAEVGTLSIVGLLNWIGKTWASSNIKAMLLK